MSFSPQAQSILQRAGWSEKTWVDPGPFEQALRDKGYPVFPALSALLQRFGGMRFTNPDAVPPAAEDWHFRVQEAIAHTVPNNIRAYGKQLGAPLSIIGEAFGGYFTLMMDESGRVFGGYDNVFVLVGDSADDAIEALCSGRELLPATQEQASA